MQKQQNNEKLISKESLVSDDDYLNGPKMTREEKEEYLKKYVPKVPQPEQFATLELPDGKKIQLPILKPTCGAPMLDIRKLQQESGHFTFDPGFTGSGSCSSKITYIDGNKGQLRYRGYDIKDLAENASYIEVCYLLLYGELPDQKELIRFEQEIVNEMCLHQKIVEFYKGFQKDAHPMAILMSVLGGGSAFMEEKTDIKKSRHREVIAITSIAKVATIAAYAFRAAHGLPFVLPKKKYGYMKNFMYMMFSNPMEDEFEVDPAILRALEVIFITHADHEQNASTSTVRISGSSYANPFAVLSSGIASLWGPAHGGANEAVLKMLKSIGSVEHIPEFIQQVKNKTVRLMGFGHRVYKNYDPRAQIMKQMCDKVLKIVNKEDSQLLLLAKELEKIALSDPYFVERKLYPNVDFYTGIIYEAIDIPENMFTCLFAVSRTAGWISHWNELMAENLQKIGRPRQLYVGNPLQKFIPLNDRPLQQESKIHNVSKLSQMTNLSEVTILLKFNDNIDFLNPIQIAIKSD